MDERGFFARSLSVARSSSLSRPFPRGVGPSAASRTTSGAGPCVGCITRRHHSPEAKLVRCTRGRIHDVIVDLRCDPHRLFRHWWAVELSAGQPGHGLHPRGIGPWIPDARGPFGGRVSDVDTVSAPGSARGLRLRRPCACAISVAVRADLRAPRDLAFFPLRRRLRAEPWSGASGFIGSLVARLTVA